MKMKLSKNKKIILLISGLGILTTSIVTPIVVINNKNDNQEKENKNYVEKVIKTLEEKTVQQRTIILPSDSSGNIIANNKEKIISKLKELIGTSNLKNVSIEVLMNQDQKISTSEQEIIVKVSKGKHSKIVSSSKVYFVKRAQNAVEIAKNLDKVNEIIAKIKDKDILIRPNVSTQNQSEIQDVIKNQLKKENQSLNEDDLSKITINNIESLTLGNKIEVVLTIKINSTIKKLTINVEKINLLKNSNIVKDINGTIFQDSFKNLWAMGYNQKLQVLKVNSDGDGYVNEGWTNDTTKKLLNGSNIIDGFSGTIFQDSFKNLWTIGYRTSLQVLKAKSDGTGYVSQGWTNDNTQGLLNGSNIVNGNGGTIFQDSFKNLWIMGKNTKLQVLKVNNSKDGYVENWTDDTNEGLLNGSNINIGVSGTIFQDSFGNLWTMGNNTKLQVLKANSNGDGTGYVSQGWTNDNTQGLLNGSNIVNGNGGTIFQDSFKNLWAMGNETKLQVLKVNNSKDGYVENWTDDTNEGLLNGSNINIGVSGRIFQDSFGNLWTMGSEKKLQVLKVNSGGNDYVESWTDDTNEKLLNGSNITNGSFGAIFQDSFKNLWAMANGTKLQVLKAKASKDSYINEGWTNDITEGLLNHSNIINGGSGTIFQDSFKNLWAMGYGTKLQVFIVNLDNTGYINSWI